MSGRVRAPAHGNLEVSIASQPPAAPTGPPARSNSPISRYAGPALVLIAFVTIAITAALGPSATEAPLGANDRGATPPWHLDATPPSWLVTTLLVVAVAAAVGALWLGLTGRWRPQARRLTYAGALAAAALAFLPPIGSADSLSYAAYGRMVVTGHNPWTTEPSSLAGSDQVERAVEVPWQHTPSVYGPLATAEQTAASAIAGPNVALTVLLLDLTAGATFIAAGFGLARIATTEAGKVRAALLWTANPLLWLELVAGAHLDVLAAGAALAAVAVAGRSRFAAGLFAGAAAAIKAPAALVWFALLWSARRSRPAILALAAGFVLVAGGGYAIAGGGLRHQLGRAAHQVSLATPWKLLARLTDPTLGTGASRQIISLAALVLFAAVVRALMLINPEIRSGAPAALAFALSFAYALAAPYALPWYDAVPWVLLPLLAASWIDALVVAHTTVLALAYLPGRAAYPLVGSMHTIAFGMREVVAPVLLLILLVLVLLTARQSTGRPEVLLRQ